MWNYRGTSATAVGAGLPTDAQVRTYCGVEDYRYYWNQASEVQQYAQYLFSVNWKILKPENFQLPDDEKNPCFYSQYNLNPQITYDSTLHAAKLTLSEAATVTVKIYKLVDGADSVLTMTLSSPMGLTHTFDVSSLDTSAKYRLEVVMSIPSKQVEVMKKFELTFNKIVSM
jgi:hypothetical protein